MPLVGSRRALLGNAGGYSAKVAAIAPGNLIAWWKMAEPSGSVALDSSGNGRNGAYTGVTLGQTGIGDGLTAASFDGSTSYNNVYSAGLASAFNKDEGTLACWAKVSAAGAWSDAVVRRIAVLTTDGNNRIYILKDSAANNLAWRYAAGGTSKLLAKTDASTTGWFHVALTWSKTADEMKAYYNGVQYSTTQASLGTWSGALAATGAVLGASVPTPADVWSGFLAHALLYNTPLTAAQILQLATVP